MYNKNIFDFTAKWPFSTNRKEVHMYLIFTTILGVAGIVLSMYIQVSFANPNFDFLIYNYILYNVITNMPCFYYDFFLIMLLLVSEFSNWSVFLIFRALINYFFVIIYVLFYLILKESKHTENYELG